MKEIREKRFALFGNPVGHSLSPRMHRSAFREMGVPARYDACRVESAGEIVPTMESLGIEGASVTLPFKETVLPCLDGLTEGARDIGAVNTIVRRGNRLIGDNTDWIGLVRNLEEHVQIAGKTFAVLGAGGMARAAVFGLLHEGGRPVIFNRSGQRGESLARAFGCRALPLADLENFRADGLIQTTPVGMAPGVDRSPLNRDCLPNFRCVMDAVYNPMKTKLLRDAEEMGCIAVDGVGLFVRQGAEQIRIWIGMAPPVAWIRRVVVEALREEPDGRMKGPPRPAAPDGDPRSLPERKLRLPERDAEGDA